MVTFLNDVVLDVDAVVDGGNGNVSAMREISLLVDGVITSLVM